MAGGRDASGDVVFAAAGAIQHAHDALHAECFALLQGIHLAEQMGVGHAIFETDCLNLKEATTGRGFDDAPLGALFREVCSMLQLNFSSLCRALCTCV